MAVVNYDLNQHCNQGRRAVLECEEEGRRKSWMAGDVEGIFLEKLREEAKELCEN